MRLEVESRVDYVEPDDLIFDDDDDDEFLGEDE
jgi:hypothetical protein